MHNHSNRYWLKSVSLSVTCMVWALTACVASADIVAEGDTDPHTADPFWNSGGDSEVNILVGKDGYGALTIDSGSEFASAIAVLGYNQGSYGVGKVQTTGSRWSSSDNIIVGYFGHALLEVAAGGRLEVDGASLGLEASGSGRISVAGSGSQLVSQGAILVGVFGEGELIIRDGGIVAADGIFGNLWAGKDADSIGRIQVTGAGSSLRGGANLLIADEGNAAVAVTGQGRIEMENSVYVQTNSTTQEASSGRGVLSLGVSGHHTLLTTDHLFNNGTVQVFSLGNLSSGAYLPLVTNGYTGSGKLRSWGGVTDAVTHVFQVSDLIEYEDTGMPLFADFSAKRYSFDDENLVVSFADDAGEGALWIFDTEFPEFSNVTAYYLLFGELDHQEVLLSYYLGGEIDPDTIYVWTLDFCGCLVEVDLDDTFATYEDGYFSFLVEEDGIYAVSIGMIPEPGHFVLLGGVLVVGFVVLRRRR